MLAKHRQLLCWISQAQPTMLASEVEQRCRYRTIIGIAIGIGIESGLCFDGD
jgi:hypothetical protein